MSEWQRKMYKYQKKKVGFIKGTVQELKKVTWPTAGELASKTGVVLGVVIVSTLFVMASRFRIIKGT